MARVSADDLSLAADWLDAYDGTAEESAGMYRVAEWLRAEVTRREKEAAIYSAAKRHNVSAKTVRRALARAAT